MTHRLVLTRDGILENTPLQVLTPLAEIDLIVPIGLGELAELVRAGAAGDGEELGVRS
jgi:hypothetical protein